MLKRLGPTVMVAGEAPDGQLFRSTLEFNPPAHGTWNIVHIGMLIPEAHQIYVCALNCMRGVVLTAAEMGAQDRFSCVVLKEDDIARGEVERVTREGIADVLHKLDKRGELPPCAVVFPVCTHLFLGIHMAHIYRELEQEFPTVTFIRAFMDPISKRRIMPDQRLRKVMYDPLRPLETDTSLVCVLGSDFALNRDAGLRTLLSAGAKRLVSIHDCKSWESYLALGHAGTFVSTYPGGRIGAERCAARLGRPHLYLPSTFSYDEIEAQESLVCERLRLPLPDFLAERQRCNMALDAAFAELGGMPIALDALAHPRPLGLARLLLEHGFAVREIYLDAVNPEEEDALIWLRTNAPQVELSSMTAPELRVAPRMRDGETLAIGQRAAWYCGTTHFVNIVQGAGLWGFAGVRTLATLICDAYAHEKDPHDLLPRKGLGCPSCF